MGQQLQPVRVVTFLFSDIEGSTWLVQRLGDAYDEALQTHRRLLRGAWADHGGEEIGTEGDSFFVAFDLPELAVRAAAAGQLALSRHSWSEGEAIRVRMGIHTGDARRLEHSYTGLAVHQAARIASAAHGGQVLVSDATRSRVSSSSLGGIDFLDLGRHRLKDLAEPVRLFQLTRAELDASFPPPRTLSSVPHNFPVQTTAFIGRDDDVAGLAAALEGSRVVTITGAGGAGKTRLGLRVAAAVIDRFPDGAWFVDLAPIAQAELVASTAADVLGVREQAGRNMLDTLADSLVDKRLLIVLDNCEHLIDACAEMVHRLVASCTGVKVLATTRETLNIPAETSWRLRSLSVPEPDADIAAIAESEAAALFVQRASVLRPEFALDAVTAPAVVQICRRLDGLPLAIELAAARVRSMSVHDIAARLDDRFRLLTGGSRLSLPRQRTLEAAVSWSYDLLPARDKTVFERLSAFAGGCTLEAAEEVCAADDLDRADVMDALDRLVERSLLVGEEAVTRDMRYKLLETLRQFGRERLIAAGSAADIRIRHLAWAVSLAARFPQEAGATAAPEAIAEEDNFRVAIQWAMESGDHVSALRITGSVWAGHFEERERLYQQLLPPSADTPADVAGRALYGAGGLAFMMGEWSLGVERLHAAVLAHQVAGNRILTALSRMYEGICAWGLGDTEEARRLVAIAADEAESVGDAATRARVLIARGWLETEFDLARAEATVLEGIAFATGLADVFELGHLEELLGFVRCLQGDHDAGGTALADAADTFHRIQPNCAAHLLETAAAWAAMTARLALGAELLGAAERIRDETHDRPRPWERAVQEVWLPVISAALPAPELARARDRGRRLTAAEALSFAAASLRHPDPVGAG